MKEKYMIKICILIFLSVVSIFANELAIDERKTDVYFANE